MDAEPQGAGNGPSVVGLTPLLPFDALELDEVRELYEMCPAAYGHYFTLPFARGEC